MGLICCCNFQADVELIKAGSKVGASEATLLNMLGISPFTYGLVLEKIYDDGSMLDPEILDITPEQLRSSFMKVTGTGITIESIMVSQVPFTI